MESDFIPYEISTIRPGTRIGVIAPHPDDEVFGPGGTLLIWRKNVTSIAIVSDGMGWDTEQQNLEIIRQNESKEACKALGLPKPEFWRYPDSKLIENREKIYVKIKRWVTLHRLDCIFIPSIWEMHRDHRACAEAGLRAALMNKHIKSVRQYEIGRPLGKINRLVDISQTFEQKKAAIKIFQSQLKMQNFFEQITALNIYRTYTLSKSCQAAEGFFMLTADQISAFLQKHKK